jgi:hypothetical protein
MMALMVCIRFSAWSKTIDCVDSNTSSVTSSAIEAGLPEDLLSYGGVPIVERWEAMHELDAGVAGLGEKIPVDPVRLKQTHPLIPAAFGSPIETHTSV